MLFLALSHQAFLRTTSPALLSFICHCRFSLLYSGLESSGCLCVPGVIRLSHMSGCCFESFALSIRLSLSRLEYYFICRCRHSLLYTCLESSGCLCALSFRLSRFESSGCRCALSRHMSYTFVGCLLVNLTVGSGCSRFSFFFFFVIATLSSLSVFEDTYRISFEMFE